MSTSFIRVASLAAAVVLLPSAACGQSEPVRATAPAASTAPAAADAPIDFSEEAKALYRLVACEGGAPPAGLDAKIVAAYCARQVKAIEAARKHAAVAGAFTAKLRPASLPATVVYPFGGGDLINALTVYPDARDVTTLSLEHAGDPRRLPDLANAKRLAESLDLIRATASGLLNANDSKTENLMKGQRGDIPGQLAFFMLGLAAHGYEPVQLRYFWINADGTLHYVTQADIATVEKENAKLLRAAWTAPDFSRAFSNSEIVFVKKGGDPATDRRVHRHIAFDLSDAGLKRNPGLLAYLQAKGPVAAMTKAASYLLWNDAFSAIRGYLLANMVFMVSDSTGVPPRLAKAAGFTQETWGSFSGSFLPASERINEDFRQLWSQFPKNQLRFRFGYLDSSDHYHLLVTRKAAAHAPEAPARP
ncbi:MAG: hypothetical protein WCC48_03495 [Anaeromyxobacteraceae bacterium]